MDKMIKDHIQTGRSIESVNSVLAHFENDRGGNLLIYFDYGNENEKIVQISWEVLFEMLAIDGIYPHDSYAAFLIANQSEWQVQD